MTPFIVLVEFQVAPADHESFRRLIVENAATSLEREPGCRQFDVAVPDGNAAGRFVLYEIYDDDAAFEVHLQSDHYRRFDAASAALVLEKSVRPLRYATDSRAA